SCPSSPAWRAWRRWTRPTPPSGNACRRASASSSRTATTRSSTRRCPTTWPSARSTSGCLPRKSAPAWPRRWGASGLPTAAGARVPFHLSGGEKRRVALAGVLAMRPEILLLDEPSMYLDPRGRRELIRLLKALPGTKMIAAHDLELVLQTCGRVLLLDRGRL